MSVRRQKLQEALCSYTSDTLADFATVRNFYERRSRWMLGRERELNLMMDIKERADKINLNLKHVVESENKQEAIVEYVSSMVNVDGKREELEKELASVLKETLGGLEELGCFLDALGKLAVTSLYVFIENQVLHLPEGISLDDVQLVIIAARQVCPLLLEFKRDANAFFLPKLQNVGVLSYQLDKYIQTTQKICQKLEESFFSEFDLKMNMKTVVELDVDWSEGDVHRMLHHIILLDKIRKSQDFRMVFLFQEEETCFDFISEFNERKPRMLRFLKELEFNCVQLDRMSERAKISSVAGSSVGAVGGVLSIVGLALLPFTAGVSLGLITGGTVMGVASGVNSLVTTATEIGVNHKHQQEARVIFKNFMDDVQVLQDCLEEVSRRETSHIDVIVGAGMLLLKAQNIAKGIDAASALKVLKNEKATSGVSKVVAEKYRALQNMFRVASDVPDVGQAALKGPLALSKAARGGLIAVNALFLGIDIISLCKDRKSLVKGSESEFSQFIRARAALWSSEIESWQKIHDSLSRGLPKSEKNKAILERLFYPEMKKKKQREAEMKAPSDEVDKKTEKVEVLNAAVTDSADWLLVLLIFVSILLLFVFFPGNLPSQV